MVKAANKHDYSSELTEIVHFYDDDIIKEELSTQLLLLGSSFKDREDHHKGDVTLKDVLLFCRTRQRVNMPFSLKIASILLVYSLLTCTSCICSRE